MKAAASLVISEVYANSPGGGQDSGEEWMEVTNTSLDESIDLNNAVLKRLDGTARAEAWSITLSDAPILAPGASLVLAQESDLGLNLCFAFDAYLLGDQFVLGNSGVQYLSLFTADGNWGKKSSSPTQTLFPMGVPESASTLPKKMIWMWPGPPRNATLEAEPLARLATQPLRLAMAGWASRRTVAWNPTTSFLLRRANPVETRVRRTQAGRRQQQHSGDLFLRRRGTG